MLNLQLPTDPRWAALVKEDLRTLLIDHAWCEHKAASNDQWQLRAAIHCTQRQASQIEHGEHVGV